MNEQPIYLPEWSEYEKSMFDMWVWNQTDPIENYINQE